MVDTARIEDITIRTLYDSELYFGLAKTYSQDWHELIKRYRRWYEFDHYKKKALPYEERYSDPTPTNVVDLATGILLANGVEFRAQGWEPTIQEEEDSSRVEKFLQGSIYVNNEREELDLIYEAVLHLVRDGATVIYSVWDPQIAKSALVTNETEQPIYMELPLRLQVVDPLQIFLLPGGPKRWGHIFRVWDMTVYDVEKTWGKRIKSYDHSSLRDKMSEKVKVKDYWRIMQKTVEGREIVVVENCLIAADEVLRPLREMEGYDDLPYTLGFFKPVERDNPRGWHGVLQPLESTIEHLETAFNRRARQILVYSALPIVSKSIPHRKVNLDPALGNIVSLGLEEDLVFPTWPGNAPDVEQHIGFLRARLQQAGFTDVMFGEGPSQVSGYALSQLGDQNRIRLAQPTAHLEMMWSSWARKALRLTSHFTQGIAGVRVYGNMKGQDFAEQLATNDLPNYMVKASVKPEFPNEKTRNHAMASQVRDLLSERTLMENYLDIEQPDDERERRQEDLALKHPLYQQFEVVQRLIRIAQSGDPVMAPAAAMVVQQMQAGMQAGPQGGGTGAGMAGRPDGGPQPQNRLGTASATGELTPQEGGAPPPGQSFGDILEQMAGAAPGMTGAV